MAMKFYGVIIPNKDTLIVMLYRMLDIYKKLKNEEPLSEAEVENLSGYFGGYEFKNRKNMETKIEKAIPLIEKLLKDEQIWKDIN